MPDYGRAHRALRRRLLAAYIPNVTLCWRCQQPITTLDTSKVHLGHDDDNPLIWRGLECSTCNLRAGGIRGNKSPRRRHRQPPWLQRKPRRSRVW